jgi:hypothetical protein
MIEHTPIPWELDAEDDLAICGGNIVLARTQHVRHDKELANAVFIIRACNSHEALVKALRAARLNVCEAHGFPGHIGKQIDAALELAEDGL